MDLPTGLPPFFENWQFLPPEAGESITFGPPGGLAISQAVATWRMDLPADPGLAAEQLSLAEEQVEAARLALEAVPGQLDDFVRRAGYGAAGPVSFGPAPGRAFSPLEQELLGWVAAADPLQVSFGVPGSTTAELQQAGRQIRQAVERLLQLLLHLAWVETQIQGELVARTVVGWSGDQGTAWGMGWAGEVFTLHRRSLRLALAARLAMVRTLIVVTQGAVKLSALIAAPGGALLAMPVAWKYVNQVLAELKNYAEISQEKEEV